MSKRWKRCVQVVLLSGLTAGLVVLTGQSESPDPGREPVKDRTPQQAVSEGEAHPLDPLSQQEMAVGVRGLREGKRVGEHNRPAPVARNEAPKEEGLAW